MNRTISSLLCRLAAFLAAAFLLSAYPAQAAPIAPRDADITFSDETLRYKVMFKWGMINKVAGRATVSLRQDADSYYSTVYARSEPWADRIYTLRDTLTTVMSRTTLAPRRYKRIAHEGGRYECDDVKFTLASNCFTADCVRHRRRKNDTTTVATTTRLRAEGMTVDFLSAFYYLRSLNFDNMLPGHSVTINIFSGKRKELLKFSFKGIDSVKGPDGRKHMAYRVVFTFTSDGKKESSDPITAWISMDSRRVPLQIEGKLKVGKIMCVLEQ